MTAQSFGDAQNDEKYLPKEPIDLPKPQTDLPLPEKEITAHVSHSELGSESSEIPKPASQRDEQVRDDIGGMTVKTLLAWKAPGRPFRKRGKQFYINGLLIMLLVLIILFLFSQYLLMLVVLSLVFVAFALASVPPHDFHYRISTQGITIEDHFFLWQELYDFYFKKRDGIDVLHIRTYAFIPGELTITLGDVHKEHAKSVLLPYLPYREYIKPTIMEKSADWLSRNFPLEKAKT